MRLTKKILHSQKHHSEMFYKIGTLKDFTIFTRKPQWWSLNLTKPETLSKKAQTQVFCCKYCEIFKNIFFCGTPPVAASRYTAPIPLIKTRNKKGKALDLPSILISFSNTRNKRANSSTTQIGLTRVNNSQAVAHKSWIARCSTHTQRFSLSKLHNCMHLQDRNAFIHSATG